MPALTLLGDERALEHRKARHDPKWRMLFSKSGLSSPTWWRKSDPEAPKGGGRTVVRVEQLVQQNAALGAWIEGRSRDGHRHVAAMSSGQQ